MPESKNRKKAAYTPPPAASGPQVSPRWLVPVMLGLMILGLVWIVVTYIMRSEYPVPGIGQWNLAIGFALILAGFALTTRWR
ncbi:cell division protein CrgA [Cellulomonas sp. NS3]|uniref:cell division protein CrgA n=1 Tax=Cellulomonas sp. NS3 TaxID=2973977 RepID=UPI002163B4D7|nr:cell division protein CrgA [Cellulomonas sp. NS3]